MRSNVLAVSLIACVLTGATAPSAFASPGKKKAKAAKESGPEISDGMQKQLDWEDKLMGPNKEKKIDLAKIQKLQEEEMARREKEKAEKEKKDREAAIAAQNRKDVSQPSTREVPSVEEKEPEKPIPPPVKHDDAFVDKLLKSDGKPMKKTTVSNDEVDALLNQAKAEEKAPAAKKSGGKDSVDALLATADKQAPIKTRVRRNEAIEEPVSAEAAAREAALKAIAAAQAKRDAERKSSGPAIPDAAVLRAQMAARNSTTTTNTSSSAATKSSSSSSSSGSDWKDPFANDSADSGSHGSRGSAAGRRGSPATTRPTTRGGDWNDPFESGGGNNGAKARPGKPAKPAKGGKGKKGHGAGWKDPFA